MIRWPLIGAAALIAGWCSGFSVGLAKAEQQARATVLSIGDGDTIRVLQGQQRLTIRLACIDAPEMAQAPLMAPTPAATCRAGRGWAPA